MRTLDAIARILKKEGIERLAFPATALIESAMVEADLSKTEIRARTAAFFRSIGYSYVTLDIEGFRSGSLNETLAGLRRGNRGMNK